MNSLKLTLVFQIQNEKKCEISQKMCILNLLHPRLLLRYYYCCCYSQHLQEPRLIVCTLQAGQIVNHILCQLANPITLLLFIFVLQERMSFTQVSSRNRTWTRRTTTLIIGPMSAKTWPSERRLYDSCVSPYKFSSR